MKGDRASDASIDDYVKTVLAQAPPLTDEQRTRLAELLHPVQITPTDRRAS